MRPLTFTLMAAAVAMGQPQPSLATPAHEAAAPTGLLRVPPPKAGRGRPLVAVVAGSRGAETTDFVVPYAVLKESGVADVVSLSTREGPVQLQKVIRIVPDATTARFDAAHPRGADIVIVPAMVNPKDEALGAWLGQQAAKGAVIVSICEGARVLAHAGLLDGRRAVTHWHALPGLEKRYPGARWVRDRRYVQDGPIISTTGVSASIPASLALVEAIAGRPVALATAHRIGVSDWSATHRTADFGYTRRDLAGAILSKAAFWAREKVEFPLSPGVDDLALALHADAWARTFRAEVLTTSAAAEVRSRHGLRIVADARPNAGGHVARFDAPRGRPPLEAAFAQIGRRYGAASVRLVRMSMEYDPPRTSLR